MKRHLFAQCQNLAGSGDAVFQWRNVRRRLRRRRAENIFQNPDAALYRRRAEILLPCDRQKTSLAEQSAAVVHFRPERHTAELSAVDVRNAIVFREPFIHERVVRCQQVEDVAIFAHHAFEEHFGFTPESFSQFVIPMRIVHAVGRRRRQIPQIEQLIREVRHQCVRLEDRPASASLVVQARRDC